MDAGAGRVSLVALLLLSGLVAGCLGSEHGIEEEQQREQRFTDRITAMGMSGSWGSSCSPVTAPPLTGDCWEVLFEIDRFLCDPPQRLLSGYLEERLSHEEFDTAAAEGTLPLPEGPSEGYVYCEYTLVWSVTGRSMLSPAKLQVEVRLDDESVQATCEIPINEECSLDGTLSGSFSIPDAGDQGKMSARLDAHMETGLGLPMVSMGPDFWVRSHHMEFETK